ncbi:YggL family protein [Zestomonas thermotolerans]|uniref:YggL 50S ribosome-binding family protein n=1 Tax=Zestomonas thermotolerans TaxID=157784 RepID=UPI0023F0B8B5|nr:50S ribosome-binding protein YggL [Pseudomonas thermotolerans]
MVKLTSNEERLRRMKRRLRKKLYLGEFQEHAFELKVSFKTALADDALDAFLDAFIDSVEDRQLCFIGGFDAEWLDGTLVAAKRYQSPSEADRQAVEAWLKARPEVASVETSALFDAHYGWE